MINNTKIMIITGFVIVSLIAMIGGALSSNFQEPPSLTERQKKDIAYEELLNQLQNATIINESPNSNSCCATGNTQQPTYQNSCCSTNTDLNAESNSDTNTDYNTNSNPYRRGGCCSG